MGSLFVTREDGRDFQWWIDHPPSWLTSQPSSLVQITSHTLQAPKTPSPVLNMWQLGRWGNSKSMKSTEYPEGLQTKEATYLPCIHNLSYGAFPVKFAVTCKTSTACATLLLSRLPIGARFHPTSPEILVSFFPPPFS